MEKIIVGLMLSLVETVNVLITLAASLKKEKARVHSARLIPSLRHSLTDVLCADGI